MSEPFKRAEEVFHAVAGAPAERRESLLAELCKEDKELRALVQRLIAHDREGMPGFLCPPASSAETIALPTRSVGPGFRVGPYQVIDVIAQGGMGTVYVAHQSKPVERDVALKLIRADIDSRNVIARFEAERQALALMDHPNIAKVLDAGETEQGQPYFVMELIRGLPITEYCDHGRLTTRARLELFRPVCEAVQHAHQKAIIHRDLKPSNVLVTEVDGRPLPKVIDFGVAKATAMRLTQRPMHTSAGALVGTLEYMSPEQASLLSTDVDTRSDVYSLGVILYELLVGELPFAPPDPHGARYEEARRRILEEDPKRPSTRLSTLHSRSIDRATARGTDVRSLRRQLMGDLDRIIVKALEKDRTRRYATPMHLAADIQRHLRDEPVEAQPQSATYRARKFIRRHRVGAATVALFTVTLLAAVAGTAAGLVRARTAESVARAEQLRSEKAATFLANTLSGIDPAKMGETLALTLRDRIGRERSTARSPAADSETPAPYASFEGVNLIDVIRSLVDEQLLGKAVHRLESELNQDPALAADLYHAIGVAYSNLQLFTPGVECSERAVGLSVRARGRDHATTNTMRVWLAGTYVGMGRYRDAERVYLEAIESLRNTLGEGARETLIAQASLGWNYQQEGQANSTMGASKRTDEAERLLRRTLERMRPILGENNRYTLWTAHGLGLALKDQQRFGEAEPLLRDVVERMSRVLGGTNTDTINATLTLAAVVYYSGRPEEAEKIALELLERSRRVVGDDSFLVLLIETKLGVVYLDQGRLNEAEGFLRDGAEKLPRVLGEESQFTKEAIAALARLEGLRSTRHGNVPER